MHSHLFISVMGTMGSGKTTASQVLGKELGYHVEMEHYQENPFLPRFYSDMKRWGFTYQTKFLLGMVEQLSKIKTLLRKTSVIQDCSIIQYVYSYAQAQRVYENMDEAEWQLYLGLYKQFRNTMPTPDLIVYLDASLETIAARIAHRARTYEHKIPADYLQLLNRLNNEWITTNTSIPLLRINTDGLNITIDHTAQQYLARLVQKSLSPPQVFYTA